MRDNQEWLGLAGSSDFVDFISKDFHFYSSLYVRIRKAGDQYIEGLEGVYYNAQNNFTLQYPLLLASVRVDDGQQVVTAKLKAVSAFVDILIARRQWNWRLTSYSSMNYGMFSTMRDIRGKDLTEVVAVLNNRLEEEGLSFSKERRFALHGQNGPQVKRILARITDFVETESERPSRYVEYLTSKGKKAYEIEHIWADHPEWHTEFDHPSTFSDFRNRIGGLLLLPKSFNASYNDLPYEKKRPHYLKQNLLAQSLHESAYEHNPGFRRFIERTGLPFKPHSRFEVEDMEERSELYRQIADRVWSAKRLSVEVD